MTYKFQLADSTEGGEPVYDQEYPAAGIELPRSHYPVKLNQRIEGLTPGTRYHVRIVATNSAGTSFGPEAAFTTYPTPPGGIDECPNALERKQTGARTLFDCRAYELVSAGDTSGYDVESSLVPGQEPYAGYPDAGDPSKVLYATHAGAVPGPWNPTNRGPDPYVATRGENGWTTRYVGLPADLNQETDPFSSVLGAADARLDSFAFAGSGLCDPCFSEGVKVGIPVRLPDGELVQGMAGSLPAPADARPEGEVAKYFSADGSHLIFATTAKLEPDANPNGAELTIYDRDLATGVTHVVSKAPGGSALTGSGIAELDLSGDGSRVVFGQALSTDSGGNPLRHLYVDVGDSGTSIDLTPGAVKGAYYAGMTADGTRAYLITADPLLPADTDSSSDLYAADITATGATLSLVTTHNSNACDPVANSAGADWNSLGAGGACGPVAVAGGEGVARESGDIYFLSPEQLDGASGTVDEPNLYRVAPDGQPRLIATLDGDDPVVVDSVKAPETRRTGDFEVTPNAEFAAFVSRETLTGTSNGGFLSVFRYAAAMATPIGCASCDPTEAGEAKAFADASLASDGLSISDDGRVFFDTQAPLVLNDTGERVDVYEWAGNDPRLISSGIGSFASRLLSVTHDGVDAYFFTHDKLSPEGLDGTQARIYDARENGGFLKDPESVPCQAADECHGAGTPTPPTPDIRTAASGPGQNTKPARACGKHRVLKNGKCKKKSKKRHRIRHGEAQKHG